MIHNVSVVYFSPTGGTKRAAFCLAEGIGEQIKEIDLLFCEEKKYHFKKEDIVIFAVPVFGGRIPEYVSKKLKLCHGAQTKAVTMVVYGNRAYDDALLELNDCIKAQNFYIGASGAIIAEHSMMREVAAQRPDEKDNLELKEFAQNILHKLEKDEFKTNIEVPGKRPYVQWIPLPIVPIVSDCCTKCGLCAEQCPTQAISKKDCQNTDQSKCMLCMRCVFICKNHARALPKQAQNMLKQKLSPLKDIRRENEFFV